MASLPQRHSCLTLAVSRCRKRERGNSVRWRRSAPVLGWARLWHEDDPEVIVRHLPSSTDKEIRGDQPTRTRQLPLTPINFPGHGTMLQPQLGTGTNVPLPDGTEM